MAADTRAEVVLVTHLDKTIPTNCGTCTSHCPTDLQPVEIMKAQIAKNTDRIMDFEPWHCIGCSLCSYVCPSKIDVSDYVKKAKLVANIQLKKLEMQKKAKEGK